MKKTLSILALVVLVAAVSVLGTLAYLTSDDQVVNTFTVGKVAITLDEAKVDANGAALTGEDAERVKENSYKLMPGHTYTKDPTIHVASDSEDCYIRATVTITNGNAWAGIVAKYAEGKIENIVKGTDDKLWWVSGATLGEDGNLTITFVYKNENKEESLKRVWQQGDGNDLVLFNKIVMPDGLTNAEIATVADTTITVKAEAIQADGFAENSNDKDAAAAAYAKAMAALDAAAAEAAE